MIRPAQGRARCGGLVAATLLVTCAAGCRATPPAPAPAYGSDRGAESAAPVAVVGGRALSKGQLADYFFDRYPEEYARTLGALLDEHLVSEHARRAGLGVPPASLDRAVDTEVEARRTQLQTVYGKEARLDLEVRRAYGVDVPTWKRSILRPRLHARLLMERVIRWDTRSRPRVHARVIVVNDEAHAQRVMAKLRRGADFSLTAVKESRDPSARAGGELPLIARGDLAFPGVEARLFQGQAGRLVGPLVVRVQGRPQWQIYKIIERSEPWTGDVAARRARLENDLAAKPMQRAEYERWRARVRRDAAVKTYRPDGRIWAIPSGR